jgi:hypothetical protein
LSPVATNTIGALLIEEWAPYITPDLEDYANAIGSMFESVDELVQMLGEDDGWGPLLDPDRCPTQALPYLAMYVGERLPTGLTLEMQREWILDHPNQQRGTLLSIVRAAQRSLTGSRAVSIVERSGGAVTHPEDFLQVRTYLSQTPYPNQVLADLYTVVPVDIQLDYATVSGQTWAALKAAKPTWDNVKSSYASWTEVQTATPGTTVWDRPRPIPA